MILPPPEMKKTRSRRLPSNAVNSQNLRHAAAQNGATEWRGQEIE